MRSLPPSFARGLLLATVLGLPVHAAELRDIRLWASPDNTRVVLDLSASVQHHVSLLKNPDRLVLDIPGLHLHGGRSVPPGAGAVKQVRVANRPQGAVRIVLDLAKSVHAKSFLTAPNNRYGYRLVIDLSSGTQAVATTPVNTAARTSGALTSATRNEACLRPFPVLESARLSRLAPVPPVVMTGMVGTERPDLV